jgi:hypothetical protein
MHNPMANALALTRKAAPQVPLQCESLKFVPDCMYMAVFGGILINIS